MPTAAAGASELPAHPADDRMQFTMPLLPSD
jgi:hypothetical protein